ncbi:MAG: extracellular solute-binding protein [Clostridiales bacterium]|nr:extracellular solute-binding protein [Clostridiales bacterium]
MKTKLTAAALLMCMLVQFAACASDTEKPIDSSANTSSSPVDTEPELPAYDFEGRDFNILCRTDKAYEFEAEETGDIVDDAIYSRNASVRDRYNVNINTIAIDGDWNARESFINMIAQSVLANDDDYQLVAGYNAYITSMITQGYLLDTNELGIDFSSPWWYSGFNDNVEIEGKKYFCLGDASLTMWENLEVVYFNKKLLEDYKLDSPYELIGNDKWTFDVMKDYCRLVSSDLNNDSVMDETDQWGMIFYNIRDVALYFENSYCRTGDDGYPKITFFSERLVDIFDDVYSFVNVDNGAHQFEPDVDQKVFSEDRALFFQGPLRYASLFRKNTSDFGIVPFPKYDENQSRYYTTVVDDLSVFCVPSVVQDKEFCGVILDALCRESSKQVIPCYYDKALKVKYSRDPESEEMLNLVRDSIYFDFGYVYSIALNWLGSFLDSLRNDDPDVASLWAAREGSYQAALDTLIDYMKENNG